MTLRQQTVRRRPLEQPAQSAPRLHKPDLLRGRRIVLRRPVELAQVFGQVVEARDRALEQPRIHIAHQRKKMPDCASALLGMITVPDLAVGDRALDEGQAAPDVAVRIPEEVPAVLRRDDVREPPPMRTGDIPVNLAMAMVGNEPQIGHHVLRTGEHAVINALQDDALRLVPPRHRDDEGVVDVAMALGLDVRQDPGDVEPPDQLLNLLPRHVRHSFFMNS